MEKDIWGNKPKTVVLYEPDKDLFDYCKNFFNTEYTVPDLVVLTSNLYPVIKGATIELREATRESVVIETIEKYKQKKGNVTKAVAISFLAIFTADQRNLSLYVQSLSDELRSIWSLVIRDHYVSNETLKTMTGKSWVVEDRYYSYSYRTSDQLPWMKCISGKPDKRSDHYWSLTSYLFLPPMFYALFMPFFVEEKEYNVVPLKELPQQAGVSLLTFRTDSLLFTELAILKDLARQEQIVLGANQKIQVSVLKKLTTQLKLSEFFPDETDRQLSLLRASLVFSIYGFFYKILGKKADLPEVWLKDLFQKELLARPTLLVPLLLPHITGLRSPFIRDVFQLGNVRDVLLSMLGLDGKGEKRGWVSLELILKNCSQNGISADIFHYYHLSSLELSNKLKGYPIYLDKLYEEMSVAFYKGFVFLLAAFGLAEIAYTKQDASSFSPFSSLQYYRLTDLGRYVFGLADSFTIPEAENKDSLFELDEKNLIVRSLTDNNPYETLLAAMAEPIGRKRYKITYTSLLNSCKTQKDVAAKVDFFKRFISDRLPKVWEDFFDSLVKRCRPLHEEKSGKYLIYRLHTLDRELLQLLSTDPVIRQYTVRAEGHLLLVEAEHLKEVVARLKFFGYLL